MGVGHSPVVIIWDNVLSTVSGLSNWGLGMGYLLWFFTFDGM